MLPVLALTNQVDHGPSNAKLLGYARVVQFARENETNIVFGQLGAGIPDSAEWGTRIPYRRRGEISGSS